MLFRCIARSLPPNKRNNMTVEELKDVIVYLQGRIEELEGKKLCECAEEPPEGPTEPTVTYKAPPSQVFVTNYDEDEECIACSA